MRTHVRVISRAWGSDFSGAVLDDGPGWRPSRILLDGDLCERLVGSERDGAFGRSADAGQNISVLFEALARHRVDGFGRRLVKYVDID